MSKFKIIDRLTGAVIKGEDGKDFIIIARSKKQAEDKLGSATTASHRYKIIQHKEV